MAATIHRSLKDLRYLLTAEEWGEAAIAHGGITRRFERLEKHGWIANRRQEWMAENPTPENRRDMPVTVADLTERGQELRELYSLDDIRGADTLRDVLES